MNKMYAQIPLCRKLNDSLQKRILHWKSSANSFLFSFFQSNMAEAVRGRGIPLHEIHFACRFWRQLPFTKTICVLLNGGDRRRGNHKEEDKMGFEMTVMLLTGWNGTYKENGEGRKIKLRAREGGLAHLELTKPSSCILSAVVLIYYRY